MTRLRLKILGPDKIHCKGCEERIGNDLRGVDRIRQVEASASRQEVPVTVGQGKIGPRQLRDRPERLGYQAQAAGESG